MPNEEGLYTKEEWSGLLADKQNEVRARQEEQATSANFKVEIANLNAKIKSLETSTAEDKAGNLDETVTKRDLLKALKDQKKELTQEYEADKQTMTKKEKEEAVDLSFDKARKLKTEEKMGKGLDFDSVWEGAKRYLKDNPSYKGVILSAKNPGEKAYEIGLLDPDIAKRVALDKKNFPNQERTPKIGAESTEIPAQYFSQERVGKMTSKEIQANLPAIRESQKKWKK